MPGRILIVDRIATARILCRTTLNAAGYDCCGCAGPDEARQVLERGGIDLMVAELGDDPAAMLAFVSEVRRAPATAQLPIIVPGLYRDAAARMAVLDAGADEVVDKPVPDALLLARIRNLLRARDSAAELALRDDTHRSLGLGFAEAPAMFRPPQSIVAITPRRGAALLDLTRGLPGRVVISDPMLPSFDMLPDAKPDLFLIDGAALRHQGRPVAELFGLVADLRGRSATRRAAQLVVLPDDSPEAAMLLDLGADDIVPARAGKTELVHRARRLLERKAMVDRLRDTVRSGLRAAMTDPLTGLWNRRYALPHLARLVETAQIGGRSLAVMVLDIDHFKAINDCHGHTAGDKVLADVAARLRDSLRPADLLARIGGEEFLVALPDTTFEHARGAAERLRERVREAPFRLASGATCQVTISVGVALGPTARPPRDEVDLLMERADAALYLAKERGRNRVLVSRDAA